MKYTYYSYSNRRRHSNSSHSSCSSSSIGIHNSRNNTITLFCVLLLVIILCQLPVSSNRISRRIRLSSLSSSSKVKVNIIIRKINSMIQKHTTLSSKTIQTTKENGKTAIETVLSIKNGGRTSSSSTATTNVAIISKQQQITSLSNTNTKDTTSNNNISKIALLYMILLSMQFGIQPIVTRKYTSPNIIRSSFVLIQEFVKLFIAFILLVVTTTSSGSNSITNTNSISNTNIQSIVKGWNIQIWISVAFVPAILYLIQNIASLTAYQNLDAMTYNVLNQTKTLSAALCCYLLMGLQQSPIQILSLLILLLSAITIEGLINYTSITNFLLSIFDTKGESISSTTTTTTDSSTNSIESIRHYTHGVFPLLLASFISGLAGAITQRSLQKGSSKSNNTNVTTTNSGGRNIYLFSIELCVASIIILVLSLIVSKDGILIKQYGFWYGWKLVTIIPIVTNSAGGILVGLVTKHAGSVQKGFALIFGILLSGILQSFINISSTSSASASSTSTSVKPEQWIGGILAGVSLYLHSSYPPNKKKLQTSIADQQDQKQQQSTSMKKIKPLKEE